MFVANESFENQFLSAISSTGDRYYRAFELSGRLTWFIVTCVVQSEGLEMHKSVCCALEEDLLALLQPMANARAVSLQRVVASEEGDGRWVVRETSKVWLTTASPDKRLLIFEDRDGTESCGIWSDQVDTEAGKRTLVFETPDTALRYGSRAPEEA